MSSQCSLVVSLTLGRNGYFQVALSHVMADLISGFIGVGYFQVAESKITVSQVIGVLLTSVCSQTVTKGRYFQVAESQVIGVLHSSRAVVI